MLDPRLAKYYNREEIQGIQLILTTVDNHIQQYYPNKSINIAYHNHLDSVCQGKHFPGLASFKHYEMRDSIIGLLCSDLTNELFNRIDPLEVHLDTIHLYRPENWPGIEINLNSRLIEYYSELGKCEDYFNRALKTCREMGTFGPPTIVAYVLCMNDTFNFCDTNHRLWVALNLLSIDKPLDTLIYEYLSRF